MKRSDVVLLQLKRFKNKFNNEISLSSFKTPRSLRCNIHEYADCLMPHVIHSKFAGSRSVSQSNFKSFIKLLTGLHRCFNVPVLFFNGSTAINNVI